jgi:hypothetical protein
MCGNVTPQKSGFFDIGMPNREAATDHGQAAGHRTHMSLPSNGKGSQAASADLFPSSAPANPQAAAAGQLPVEQRQSATRPPAVAVFNSEEADTAGVRLFLIR